MRTFNNTGATSSYCARLTWKSPFFSRFRLLSIGAALKFQNGPFTSLKKVRNFSIHFIFTVDFFFFFPLKSFNFRSSLHSTSTSTPNAAAFGAEGNFYGANSIMFCKNMLTVHRGGLRQEEEAKQKSSFVLLAICHN